jgi:hypothetical protein
MINQKNLKFIKINNFMNDYKIQFIVLKATVIFALLSTINCTTPKNIWKDIHSLTPPNAVYIKDGWFIDRTEVTNINYREYLHFLRHRYSDTNIYLSSLPDTTVWREMGPEFEFLVTDYFRGEPYDNQPVVGVSFDQALAYSKWRSNRVMEMLLIEKGLRAPAFDAKDGEVFSIEKYFTSEIHRLPKDKQLWYYPHFDMPSKEEWEAATIVHDSIFKKRNCSINDHIISSEYLKDKFVQPRADKNTCKFDERMTIQNMKGNVCEWIKDGKMCGGGSYIHTLEHIQKSMFFSVKKPEVWVGFRNVSRMKKWE